MQHSTESMPAIPKDEERSLLEAELRLLDLEVRILASQKERILRQLAPFHSDRASSQDIFLRRTAVFLFIIVQFL